MLAAKTQATAGRRLYLQTPRRSSRQSRLEHRDFYTDETREIVGRFSHRDIERFGYDFDNAALAAVLPKRDRQPED